ncbi:MAG: DUF1294 domain-containing protein, partial [Myxococcota bacterium]
MRRTHRAFSAIAAAVTGLAAAFLLYSTPLDAAPAYVIAASFAAFLLCGYDKLVAGRGARRVPEAVLLGSALLGGSLGLVVGMWGFRHKTRKTSFKRKLALVVVAQVGLAAVFLTGQLDRPLSQWLDALGVNSDTPRPRFTPGAARRV